MYRFGGGGGGIRKYKEKHGTTSAVDSCKDSDTDAYFCSLLFPYPMVRRDFACYSCCVFLLCFHFHFKISRPAMSQLTQSKYNTKKLILCVVQSKICLWSSKLCYVANRCVNLEIRDGKSDSL